MRLVREWRAAIGLPSPSSPGIPDSEEVRILTANLVVEESDEAAEALFGAGVGIASLADVAQELADLVYVAYGAADAYGIDLDRVLDEVHRANMSKLVDGQPVRREDGKVLKGPGFRPADVQGVLDVQGVTLPGRAVGPLCFPGCSHLPLVVEA